TSSSGRAITLRMSLKRARHSGIDDEHLRELAHLKERLNRVLEALPEPMNERPVPEYEVVQHLVRRVRALLDELDQTPPRQLSTAKTLLELSALTHELFVEGARYVTRLLDPGT